MGYRSASLILRCGTILGLITITTGLVLGHKPVSEMLVLLGLVSIIITPLISLMLIGVLSILKRDFHTFILSQITIGTILLSILLSAM